MYYNVVVRPSLLLHKLEWGNCGDSHAQVPSTSTLHGILILHQLTYLCGYRCWVTGNTHSTKYTTWKTTWKDKCDRHSGLIWVIWLIISWRWFPQLEGINVIRWKMDTLLGPLDSGLIGVLGRRLKTDLRDIINTIRHLVLLSTTSDIF